MTRVVVAAWLGSGNLGDELLFSALAAKLRARDVEVVAPSLDPEQTAALHGVEALGHLDVPGLLRALGGADGVVFGGGGLLQDGTSLLSPPYQLWRLWAAALRRTPVVGVGLGAGPLRARSSRALVRATLRRHRGLAVRDAASAALLRQVGVPEVTVSADLAFSLPPPTSGPEDRIVACLRPVYPSGGLLPGRLRVRQPDSPEIVPALARALDDAAGRTGLGVHLVAFEAHRDEPFARAVARAMQAPATVSAPTTPQAALEEVAASRVVVATRFHGAVCAVLGGRPVVTLGYAPKVEALSEALGPAAQLLTPDPSGVGGISDAVLAVLGRDEAAESALALLRERERGNDEVLDHLV